MEGQALVTRWANLCSEFLSKIALKCSAAAASFVFLDTICHAWYRSLINYCTMPPMPSPQPPFLLVPHSTIAIPSLGNVVRLPFNDPKLINLPQLESTKHRICIGSSHGWLITLGQDSSVSLLNPVTRDSIHLHPLSSINDEVLSFKRDRFPEYSLKGKGLLHSQCSIVRFAILSSDPAEDHDFTLLLFLSCLTNGCFTLRGRGGKWSLHVHQPFEREVEDVVFINGVFVTIDRLFHLKIFDFRNNETGLVVKQRNELPMKKPFGNVFLVNSDGHLLVVYTRLPFSGTKQSSIPRGNINVFYFPRFPVDGVDIKGKRISKLKGIVLFIGHGCSVAVSVQHFPWLKENMVYFTHYYTKLEREPREGERMIASNQGAAISICQNNISDGSRSESTKVIDAEISWCPDYWSSRRPFWVTPNLRSICG